LVFFRFGFALANLGDINKDRYEDLAVGAPYEGKGVVYIYLGSKHGIPNESRRKKNMKNFKHVFLIRSRPIIGILTRVQPEENLKNIDPNTPGCEKYPNSTEVW
jgi:hypothetical protein